MDETEATKVGMESGREESTEIERVKETQKQRV
jgi:hypothetical protein